MCKVSPYYTTRNDVKKIQDMNMLELDPVEQRALEKYMKSALARNLRAFFGETADDYISIDNQYPMNADDCKSLGFNISRQMAYWLEDIN